MIQLLKKKALFFLGVLFTGFVSVLSFFISSRDDSLFVTTASADIASWSGTDAGGGGGSSCGGCSGAGGDSAAGGGGG